jgi:hypothetical protein
MNTYIERRKLITSMLETVSASLMGQPYERIDYEIIARQISSEVGAPVVVFAAPDNSGHGWRLVAYEVPEV